MTAIRIVGVDFSNYVQSVLLALREKGVAWELVRPTPMKEPAHLALHPWGKVPVALLDDGPLYETSAILRWIDTTFPTPALMPVDPRAAARAEQWISAINSYVDRQIIRDIAVPGMRAKRAGGSFTPSAEALATVEHDLDVFEKALGTGPFLGGASPILPDLMLAPIVNYIALGEATRPMLYLRPALTGFLAAVHARPSAEGILKKPV
jgi:glutathione S-transferase